MSLDRRLLVWLRTTGHTPAREAVVERYSRLGEHALGWLAIGAVGAGVDPDPARRAAWRRGVRTILGAYAGNQALKYAVARPRPQLEGLPQLTSTMSQRSFPSAHATTGFAAARAYRGLLPGSLRYGLATTLALSRPWLGVHYPSDIAAGALLGTLIGEGATR